MSRTALEHFIKQSQNKQCQNKVKKQGVLTILDKQIIAKRRPDIELAK